MSWDSSQPYLVGKAKFSILSYKYQKATIPYLFLKHMAQRYHLLVSVAPYYCPTNSFGTQRDVGGYSPPGESFPWCCPQKVGSSGGPGTGESHLEGKGSQ